jgi:hypothetical protein
VTNSAAESTTSGVLQDLSFDSERYDTADLHDPATNNSRLTAPVTGIYAVNAGVGWLGDPDGYSGISVIKNDATAIASQRWPAVATTGTFQTITDHVLLQAGDYLEVRVVQTSGNPLDVQKGIEFSPEFSMTWLAPGP